MEIRGKGPQVKGSIAGTHYDPTSAIANRGQSKRRPAPVQSNQSGRGSTKIGG